MNNYVLKCKIDLLFDKHCLIGISIDLSDDIKTAIVNFDLLIYDKINSISLFDKDRKRTIFIRKGERRIDITDDKINIDISHKELDAIQSMLLDVFINNGFNGYHYDIDFALNAAEIQLSIIFQ